VKNLPLQFYSEFARREPAVRCPNCGKEAAFADPYIFLKDDSIKSDLHLPRIKTDFGFAVIRFPRVFPWCVENSALSTMTSRLGVLSCRSCPCRRKHKLTWPKDAFYKIEVCRHVLWGWDRTHFISIRDFIASKERDAGNPAIYVFKHDRLPPKLLEVSRRNAVVRAIDQFLQHS